jgi:glycosyltransferase involved in cell wall biosynthesis
VKPHHEPGRTVHAVLPNDIDDPAVPSGGNAYDRRVCDGLTALGWRVREHAVRGGWPAPEPDALDGLGRVMAGLPAGAIVLVDGLIASAVPDVLAPHARRLRLAVLVHMPLVTEAEREALTCTTAIVTTSHWTRRRLLALYGLPAGRVHAAPPGTDPAEVTAGSADGGRLLCVAAVTPHKGHDVLAAALAPLTDLPWTCVCVGSLDRDPRFAAELGERIAADGLASRVSLAGARTGDGVAAAYADADLLVLASRGETYGMVVTEALARGVPVLATDAGGIPEALGVAPDGGVPGLLVPPGDPAALAAALRAWLTDPDLRGRLRRSARARRETLTGWDRTAECVSRVLAEVAA